MLPYSLADGWGHLPNPCLLQLSGCPPFSQTLATNLPVFFFCQFCWTLSLLIFQKWMESSFPFLCLQTCTLSVRISFPSEPLLCISSAKSTEPLSSHRPSQRSLSSVPLKFPGASPPSMISSRWVGAPCPPLWILLLSPEYIELPLQFLCISAP